MLQTDRNRAEQVQDLNRVDTIAPAAITEAIAANQARSALAREYATEAMQSLNPNSLSAENMLDAGAALLEEGVINRIANLLGDSQEANPNRRREEFLNRSQAIGTTASEALQGDLGNQVSTTQLEQISVDAARQAERILATTMATFEAGQEVAPDKANTDTLPAPGLAARRIGLGGRVENLVLATSDYPLIEMQGPGFEMLAEEEQRPEATAVQELEANPLLELSAPRGFDRQTGTFTRTNVAPAPRVETAVDYATADLGAFAFTTPNSINSTSYKLELARAVQQDSAPARRAA